MIVSHKPTQTKSGTITDILDSCTPFFVLQSKFGSKWFVQTTSTSRTYLTEWVQGVEEYPDGTVPLRIMGSLEKK
jgi:hypothetical protein